MFMFSIGGNLPKLGNTADIVGTFIFVCVSAFDCMNSMKVNVNDMDDKERTTNFDKKLLDAPWRIFKGLRIY